MAAGYEQTHCRWVRLHHGPSDQCCFSIDVERVSLLQECEQERRQAESLRDSLDSSRKEASASRAAMHQRELELRQERDKTRMLEQRLEQIQADIQLVQGWAGARLFMIRCGSLLGGIRLALTCLPICSPRNATASCKEPALPAMVGCAAANVAAAGEREVLRRSPSVPTLCIRKPVPHSRGITFRRHKQHKRSGRQHSLPGAARGRAARLGRDGGQSVCHADPAGCQPTQF